MCQTNKKNFNDRNNKQNLNPKSFKFGPGPYNRDEEMIMSSLQFLFIL